MADPAVLSTIHVFLVVENRFLRESLTRLFRKRPELVVAGETSPSELASFSDVPDQCDVVVGDCFVPSSLRNRLGEKFAVDEVPRIVLIGMSANEEQFLAAVRAGIAGYLLADASASDVIAAVRAVARGEVACPPRLCSVLFRFVAQSARPSCAEVSPLRPDLTLRQQQLLTLVAKGLTNKEIAAQLHLSEFTVRNHIQRILRQLDAESRDAAVEVVRAQGYLTAV